MEFIPIYEEEDYINTLSVKELLETSGFNVFMPNENLANIIPGYGLTSGCYRLTVPQDQADAALELLRAHNFIDDKQQESNPDEETEPDYPLPAERMGQGNNVVLNGREIPSQPVCPQCGSDRISKANGERIFVAIISFLTNGVLIPGDSKMKCRNCRHTWVQ